MKKVVSLILVIAMFASLAVAVSAHSANKNWVEHARDEFCDPDAHCLYLENWVGLDGAAEETAASSQYTQIMAITEGTKQTWVTCATAITAADMQAAAEAFEDAEISHLTVFKQRDVENEEGAPIELTVRLWPCGKKNATVILFKGVEEDAVWTIVGYAKDKICDAVLPGNGSYAVCMAW